MMRSGKLANAGTLDRTTATRHAGFIMTAATDLAHILTATIMKKGNPMISKTIDQHHYSCGCTVDFTNSTVIKCAEHSAVNFMFYKPTEPKPPEASAHFVIHGDGRIEQKRPINGTVWRQGIGNDGA